MHGFIQKVQQALRDQALLEPRQPVWVACSGGPDSVACTQALSALRHPLTLVYVDHQTRAETSVEGEFVLNLAESLGAQARIETVNLGPRAGLGEASEEVLRSARYQTLDALPDGPVVTGHTASDQAETVLMRLVRGAGTVGLSGIPPRRGRYRRPLLSVTRAEVIRFLGDLGQPYCTDPGNASLEPTRNRVRHELLPWLARRMNPNVAARLVSLADSMRSDRGVLESLAAQHLAEHGLALAPLRSAHPGLWPHIVRAGAPVSIPAERMAAIVRLIRGSGGAVQLEGGVLLVAESSTGALCFLPAR